MKQFKFVQSIIISKKIYLAILLQKLASGLFVLLATIPIIYTVE